ncbi:phage tail protein [Pseudomonas aeruginosa]|uniref:phage tail protein n=1 Tax=Pseudomonas aeruginosa TaxID=287 RepID=UPI0010B69E7C|nr:phage tail protein [Pseudomonas aeruginosa]VFT24530.1 tail fiber assembly protein [Pseudomonas aeruginosa]
MDPACLWRMKCILSKTPNIRLFFVRRAKGSELLLTTPAAPFASTPPAPAKDVLIQRERIWRDRQLQLTDGPIARHRDEQDLGKTTTLSQEQLRELTLYRATLRDWPVAAKFPDLNARPEPPAWLEPLITP